MIFEKTFEYDDLLLK